MPGRNKAKPKGRGAKRSRKRVIEMVPCEHCQGTGQRARVMSDVVVVDALASLAMLAAKHGAMMSGGLDREVCWRGNEMMLEEIGPLLTPAEGAGLAREFVVSGWEVTPARDAEWRTDWDLESLLRNRVKMALETARREKRELTA